MLHNKMNKNRRENKIGESSESLQKVWRSK
nr:MAG TPA: hypothetical protein [Caudoviricetes sp.]DAK75286.1 MAG TPA: hypothetical protein [Caudoviricetes sp.]